MTRAAGRLAGTLLALVVACTGTAIWLFAQRAAVTDAAGVDVPVAVAIAVFVGGTATTGALLARRLPRHPIGWLLLAAALGYAVGGMAVAYIELAVSPGQRLPVGPAAVWLGNLSFGLGLGLAATFVLLLFPTGRLPSPRWRPVAWTAGAALFALLAGVTLGIDSFTGLPFANPLAAGSTVGPLLETGGAVLLSATSVASAASLVVRYRRARGVERQQLKWVAYAAALNGVALAVLAASTAVLGSASLADDAENLAVTVAVTLIPVAIGIAILRHNLFDIDRIISRTIAYGAVTAALAAVYLGIAVVPVVVFAVESDLLVAAATLAAAAVFRPLRRRVQAAVDRRFDRARYDAARTVAAFSGRLRGHIGLESLRNDVADVVRETVAPASVSVWVPPRPTPGHGARP